MKPAPVKRRTDPVELSSLLVSLARRYDLGTVGLAGRHAAGIAREVDPLEVFVTVPVERATMLGAALAEAFRGWVHVYDVNLVSWSHPLHLCVRWLNVDKLPAVECPAGAVSLWRIEHAGGVTEAKVPLDTVPHFRPVPNPRTPPRGAFAKGFGPPPVGGFLI